MSDDFSPGLAWLPGGDLLFEDIHHDLRRFRAEDGTTGLVATADQVGQVFHVRALPDGSGALVTGCDGWCDASTSNLSWVDLERDTVMRLRSDVWMAWPMSDGRVVMVDGEGARFASVFDPADGSLGPPVPLLDGIRVSPFPDVAMGLDGSLLYVAGPVERHRERLVWVDRDGGTLSVDSTLPATARVRSLSLSPDGSRLALGMITDGAVSGEQIWIEELATGAVAPLTEGPARARRPVWSPDARTVAFITQFEQDSAYHSWVSTVPADASASARETLLRHDAMILEVAMSRDWRTAVVRLGDAAEGAGDIAFTSLTGTATWRTPFESGANEYGIALSPDGRWLAYTSEASGRPEVYVRPFPGPGPRVQVSTDGAVEPRWAHSGRELFFRSLKPDAAPNDHTKFMVAATVRTDPAFRVESVRELFGTPGYERGPRVPLYDVSADDQRFIMVTQYTPRDWSRGDAVYSRGWYWSDEIQAKLRR